MRLIKHKSEKKEGNPEQLYILNLAKTEMVISKICYFLLAFGITLFIILLCIFGIYHINWGIIFSIMISGVITLALFFAVSKSRGKNLHVTPSAKEYFNMFAKSGMAILLMFLTVFIAGLVFALFVKTKETGTVLLVVGITGISVQILKRNVVKGYSLKSVPYDDKSEYYDHKKEIFHTVISWSIYWTVVAIVYISTVLLFGDYIFYLPILIFGLLNFILRVIVNNPFKRYAGIRKNRLTVRLFTYCIVVLAIVYCFVMFDKGVQINYYYIKSLDYSNFSHNSEILYDEKNGVYTVRATKDELRVLQLTDIHLCGSLTTFFADQKSINACYETIKAAKPDLIIVTGDIVYPVPVQTFSRNNAVPFWHFCEFMDRVGIPWAFVYGNHDTEVYANYDNADIEEILYGFAFEKDTNMFEKNDVDRGLSLLYSRVKPNVYGRYNNYLRIEDKDGRLERLIFLMDSNDYVPEGQLTNEYDSVHEDQIKWYENTVSNVSMFEGHTVKSFIFMHIPFKQFAEAQSALEAGSGDASYLFGTNNEKISCPDADNGFFDTILRLGSTEAVFAGHDHLNNMAVKYKNIDLVYGRSIDYIAYPKISQKRGHRGGVLIIIENEGYSYETIIYSD